MREDLEFTLQRLSQAFTVRDIMTARESLKSASTDERADKLYEKFNFETVPYLDKRGLIAGYRSRQDDGSWRWSKLDIKDVISDGTNINVLIGLFEKNIQGFFVLSSNIVEGFVHYADLNSLAVRIHLYVQISAVENHLWQRIKNEVDEPLIQKVFKEDEATKILNSLHGQRKQNVDRGWDSVLYLWQFFRLAECLDELPKPINKKDKKAIDAILGFRNDVVHVDRELIATYNDLKRLRIAKDYCNRIIEDASNI